MNPESPSQSQLEMREMVMPHHANPLGTIFGGVVMSWVDLAASMCASRHSHTHVVTAHVDSFSFVAPIKVGDHVLIQACVNYVGRTSMEVGVKVWKENPRTKEREVTTKAYLTMVAIDLAGKTTPVPPLKLETENEKRRHANGKKRVALRKELNKKLKN